MRITCVLRPRKHPTHADPFKIPSRMYQALRSDSNCNKFESPPSFERARSQMQSPLAAREAKNHASQTEESETMKSVRVIIFKESSRCFEIQCTPSHFIKVFAPCDQLLSMQSDKLICARRDTCTIAGRAHSAHGLEEIKVN